MFLFCRNETFPYICIAIKSNAQVAELVDALVSNTSGATRAGSIPALGTKKNPFDDIRKDFFYGNCWARIFFGSRLKVVGKIPNKHPCCLKIESHKMINDVNYEHLVRLILFLAPAYQKFENSASGAIQDLNFLSIDCLWPARWSIFLSPICCGQPAGQKIVRRPSGLI